VTALLRRIRWFGRFSRPRASRLFEHRVTSGVFGALVFGLTLTRDLLLALLGALLGAIGVATILALGNLVLETAEHVL
jgi:hypothetical protein